NPVTVKTTGTDTVIDSITAATTITTQFGYLGFTATARVGLIPPYYWAPNTITQDNLTFANSPYTVNALTSDRHLNVDTTNGDVTLTLPTALSSAGHFLSIRKTDTLNNNITIALNGIDEIKDQYANTFALSTYILSNKEPELVLLSVYDGSTYYWTTQNPEPISASKPYPIVAGNQIVLVDATNSELTLQLPSATANPGKNIIVQRLDVTSNLVTLKPVSSETLIDLTTPSTTLTSSNPLVTLVSTLTAVNSAVYYWKVITGVTYQATSGYNTGYYTTFDPACVQGGPILSTDPLVNSTLVGGAYFDIDRSQLGPNENLLLNLTFFPLDSSNTHLNKTAYSLQESPIIKIHLVKTGQSGDTIRSITQPRILSYGSTDQFPQAAEKIAIIGSPTGQIQEQQIFIPISIDPGIDRIHVQRHSGNIIFIDATLFRMGYR
ncbi:MAG: hypothetical protein ABI041_00560, partial [Bdellovibrionia bacterium]